MIRVTLRLREVKKAVLWEMKRIFITSGLAFGGIADQSAAHRTEEEPKGMY